MRVIQCLITLFTVIISPTTATTTSTAATNDQQRNIQVSLTSKSWPTTNLSPLCEVYVGLLNLNDNSSINKNNNYNDYSFMEYLDYWSDDLNVVDPNDILSNNNYTQNLERALAFIERNDSKLTPFQRNFVKLNTNMRSYAVECELQRMLARKAAQAWLASSNNKKLKFQYFPESNDSSVCESSSEKKGGSDVNVPEVFAVVSFPSGYSKKCQLSDEGKALSGNRSEFVVVELSELIAMLPISSFDFSKPSPKANIRRADEHDFDDESLFLEHEIPYPKLTSESRESIQIVLYGTIGTPDFSEWFKTLRQAVDSGEFCKIQFIIRNSSIYYYKELPTSSLEQCDLQHSNRFCVADTMLSGYGVSLDIKNTEYKAFEEENNESSYAAKKGNFQLKNGVNVSILGSRAQVNGKEIDLLLSDLSGLVSNPETPNVQKWQSRRLSFQATSLIQYAQDPLWKLQDLVQNLPTRLNNIMSIPIDPLLKKETAVIEGKISIPSDASLYVNGIHINVGRPSFNIFQALDLIKDEEARLTRLEKIISPFFTSHETKIRAINVINELISDKDGETDDSAIRVDVGRGGKGSIVYSNNIEKDEMYASWPTSFQYFQQSMMGGGPPVVKRNLFTLLIVVDPFAPNQKATKEALYFGMKLIQSSYPVRIAILLTSEDDMSECLKAQDEWKSRRPSNVTEQSILDVNSVFELFQRASDLTYMGGVQFLVSLLEYVENWREYIDDTFTRAIPARVVLAAYNSLAGQTGKPKQNNLLQSLDYLQHVEMYENAVRFALSKNISTGMSFLNGIPLPENPEEYKETALNILQDEANNILSQVMKGDIAERRPKSVYAHLLSGKNVYKSYHRLLRESDSSTVYVTNISTSDKSRTINLVSSRDNNSVPFFIDASLNVCSAKSLYTLYTLLSLKNNSLTIAGDELSFSIQMRSTNSSCPLALLMEQNGVKEVLKSIVEKLLNHHTSSKEKIDIKETLRSILSTVSGVKEEQRYSLLSFLNDLDDEQIDALSSEKDFLLLNGRRLNLNDQPLKMDDLTMLCTMELDYAKTIHKKLHKLFHADSSDKLAKAVSTIASIVGEEKSSNMVVDPVASKPFRSNIHEVVKDLRESTLMHSWNREDSSLMKVCAVLDPMSMTSQRLSHLLLLIRDQLQLPLDVLLLPGKASHESMPLKRFYRFVTSYDKSSVVNAVFQNLPREETLTVRMDVPEPFDIQQSKSIQDTDNLRCKNGKDCSDYGFAIELLDRGGYESIEYLNHEATTIEYELKSLLFFGHCVDLTSGAPPNGLQLSLSVGHSSEDRSSKIFEGGSSRQTVDEEETYFTYFQRKVKEGMGYGNDLSTPETKAINTHKTNVADTVVMKNLGYWQLRANVGVFELSIAEGSRGSTLFDVVDNKQASLLGSSIKSSEEQVQVVVEYKKLVMKDFSSRPQVLPVRRKIGKESVDLVVSETDYEKEVVENNKYTPRGEDETIHVFSLATGHLYERFLKIMMLSVTRRSSRKVKFWLFENYLSPSFKASAEAMAEAWGFEVEFVTYKWPEWLRAQTEKQRRIWGYKILFLDVLFPLDVKRVIYVDADQVVRGDLAELWNMDLKGAPYGYTPFCDSRAETRGFQFWQQGYWKDHLRGKPYHISALYVVDLQRFRRLAIGDILRETYQNLSADPNSLSNLDQDLPNYAQHLVPIFSLPQDWLWCETWCSDSTKKYAKTIDLCNNPLHKENKLSMAKRIVSGELFEESWVELDELVRQF